jgi:quinoprotein glucose dehydrogenase
MIQMLSRSRAFPRVALAAIPVLVALAWTAAAVRGQSGTGNGEWRTYGGDLGSTRYAPLDQIDRGNLPAPQTGTPMTYMLNGKQYLVVAVGGGSYSAEFLAYALP